MAALLASGATWSDTRMSEMMSCRLWRLSKIAAARGCRAANVGATIGVIGIAVGKSFGIIARKRATAPSMPARRGAGCVSTISGSYNPTCSQW